MMHNTRHGYCARQQDWLTTCAAERCDRLAIIVLNGVIATEGPARDRTENGADFILNIDVLVEDDIEVESSVFAFVDADIETIIVATDHKPCLSTIFHTCTI